MIASDARGYCTLSQKLRHPEGLPPPSQQFLPDMEPELPSAGIDQSERAIELRRSED